MNGSIEAKPSIIWLVRQNCNSHTFEDSENEKKSTHTVRVEEITAIGIGFCTLVILCRREKVHS